MTCFSNWGPRQYFFQIFKLFVIHFSSESEIDDTDTDGEPSDGISIISESDCCPRLVSPAPSNAEGIHDDIVDQYRNQLTVPVRSQVSKFRPDTEAVQVAKRQTIKMTNTATETDRTHVFEFTAGKLVYFSVLAGVTGIVLAHYFKLSRDDCSILNHISPLVHRINDLEQQNTEMKSLLNGFQDARDERGPDLGFYPQPLEYYVKNTIKKGGRFVWRGDGLDPREPVLLPNRKLEIPEFCNHPDNGDDLFADVYAEICDKRKMKLSKIISKTNYADQSTQTGEEIKPIVNQAGSELFADDESSLASEIESPISRKKEKKLKKSTEKETKSKKKRSDRKLKRQQNVHDDDDSSKENIVNIIDGGAAGSEWMENRKKSRDEWREKNRENMKKIAENWYLTRANWREAQRNKNDKKNSDNLKKVRAFWRFFYLHFFSMI